jgi:hypothetical protein
MNPRGRVLLLLVLGAAIGSAPRPVMAYFDDVVVGARGIAMGAASSALVTDASAYYWNPAALATVRRAEAFADYSKPYAVLDLSASALAVAGRQLGTGWAFAWHRYGIARVYSEDQFCVAAGHRVLETARGHQLSAGMTFKLGRIAFQPFNDPTTSQSIDLGAQTKGSVDVGLKWTTPWLLDFSGVVRDLNEPRYQFVEGSGGDLQRSQVEIASALRWNRESTITFGWVRDKLGAGSLSTGIEVQFFDVFAVRSGISNLSRIYQDYGKPTELGFNAGFGVFHKGYFVDAAASASHDLGASYRVSLRVPFGGGVQP